MNHKSEQRLYRIGDYARHMGVSTDLLKHYEKCGLLRSVTAVNGYRYYPFQASVALLECMRLRQYGFSLRETKAIMHDASFEEVHELMNQRAAEMRRQIAFQQMVVEEHEHISRWMAMMKDRTIHVIVKEVEPVLFLPHSHHRDFIEDERITALLPAWVDAMPLVKSCCLSASLTNSAERSWGLVVAKSHADMLQLPTNDVVCTIPGGLYAHVHFRHPMATHPADFREQMQHILQQYDVIPDRHILQFTLMTLDGEHSRTSCGWFCAPLREPATQHLINNHE